MNMLPAMVLSWLVLRSAPASAPVVLAEVRIDGRAQVSSKQETQALSCERPAACGR
jgi:hypothetical protein